MEVLRTNHKEVTAINLVNQHGGEGKLCDAFKVCSGCGGRCSRVNTGRASGAALKVWSGCGGGGQPCEHRRGGRGGNGRWGWGGRQCPAS
eukprot:145986-Chlamydomonas_euryale.AAC.1